MSKDLSTVLETTSTTQDILNQFGLRSASDSDSFPCPSLLLPTPNQTQVNLSPCYPPHKDSNSDKPVLVIMIIVYA